MSDTPVSGKLRRYMILIAALVLMVAIGVGAVAASARYKESPRHSLAQLTVAVTDKDWSGVERYIDVDAVASSYMDALLTNAQGDAAAEASATLGREGVEDNGGGMDGDESGTTMNPVFLQLFRDSLRKAVESGSLSSDAGGLASVLLGKKAKDVEYESADVALVTVEVPSATGDTQVITLRMKRAGGLWRITAVANLDDLLGPLN